MNRYKLLRPLLALQWTGRNAETVHLPQEAIIDADGPSALGNDMVDVFYNGEKYTMFLYDLRERTSTEPVLLPAA